MPTDAWKLLTRPLLALALSAGLMYAAPGVAAAQSPPEMAAPPAMPEPPQPPEPPVADITAEGARIDIDDDEDRVHILGGSRTIAEGESVRDVLVVGGNLRVRGEVRGDAVVVGGNLTLYETGRVRGDVVVAGGRFRNEGGMVGGEVRSMDRIPGVAGRAERVVHTERHERSMFGRIWRGFAGVVSTLALVIVLAGAGAALIFYGHRYLETVSDTLRASAPRSGAVGLAAAFLIVPAFVVLIVALAVSIVGIPLLLVAIPLYPLAVAAAAMFGLLAAAYAIGERTSEQRSYSASRRNGYVYLATGLLVLFAPVLMGHLVGMTPFLGWVGGLIKFFSYAIIWVATTAGLGAVILSRAGTRRTFARRPAPPEDPILDDDPFLERSEV
jgi:cytoskeletal protein CcmA (bactofilin family)